MAEQAAILDIGPPRVDQVQPERSVAETTDWLRKLHKTLVDASNESSKRLSDLESGSFSTALTPEGHGCVGDGVTNDSAGFTRFIEYLHLTGDIGRLQGSYLIPDFEKFKVTREIYMFGQHDAVSIDGGSAGVELFDMVAGTLVFENIRTTNLALISSFNTTEGDIDEIRIRKWRWKNDGQLSVLVRINFSTTTPYKVKRLIVQDVIGDGGLGGVAVIAPIEVFIVTNYECRNIYVPNLAQHFFANGRMQGSGYSDGLNLGDDDPDASKLCLFGHVDGVFIENGLDERVPRPGDDAQAMDGMRLICENVQIGNYTCRNWRSVSKNDNTGFYAKGTNCRASNITVYDAGYHEGSVTFKGARRDSGGRAPGYNIHVSQLQILGSRDENGDPVFTGRGALYLGPGDIYLSDVHIEGVGGPTEDPYNPGETPPGMGPIVHCQASQNQRLTIENLNIVDCVVGGPSACRVIGVEGYDNVSLSDVRVTRVSNAGKFSNQDPAVFPTIRVIDLIGPATTANFGVVDLDLVHIQNLTIRELSPNGANVVGIGVKPETMTVHHLRIRDYVADDTVEFGLQTTGNTALGYLDWTGGDMRLVDTPFQQDVTPTMKSIRNVLGIVEITSMKSSFTGTQSIPSHATDFHRIDYLLESGEDWDDAEHEWVCPISGFYLIQARLQWDNTAVYKPKTRIRLERTASTVTLEETRLPTTGSSPEHEHLVTAYRTVEAGEKVFVEGSQNSGSARDVGSVGGINFNSVNIVRLD